MLINNREKLRSIIFINAGALIDLTEKWFADEEKKIITYVFDNHRPINHNNVNSEKKVRKLLTFLQILIL